MGREARFFAYKICFTARPSATDLQGTSAITPLGTNPLKHLVTRSMIQTSNLKPNTNRYRIFLKVGWVGWCRFIHLVKHFTAFSEIFQVTVKVMLYIMSLVSVDQKEQQMEVHGFYRTQWVDQRLAMAERFKARS